MHNIHIQTHQCSKLKADGLEQQTTTDNLMFYFCDVVEQICMEPIKAQGQKKKKKKRPKFGNTFARSRKTSVNQK